MKKNILIPVWLIVVLFFHPSLAAQDGPFYPWPHQGPDLDEIQVDLLRSQIHLSRVYGQMNIDTFGKLRSIDGLEILLDAGTPIYAIMDGTVLHVDRSLVVIGRYFERPNDLYWNFIQPFAYYSGIIPAANLQVGAFVNTGHQIGTVSQTEDAPNRFFIGLGSNNLNQYFPDGIDFTKRYLINFSNPLPHFIFPDTRPPEIAALPIITTTSLIPLEASEPLSQNVNIFLALHDTGESFMFQDKIFTEFGFPPKIVTARVIPLDPDNNNIHNPVYTINFSTSTCKDGILTYSQYQWPSIIYHLEMMLPVLQEVSNTDHYPYWVGSLMIKAMDEGPYLLEVKVSDYHDNFCTAVYPFTIAYTDVIKVKKGKDKR